MCVCVHACMCVLVSRFVVCISNLRFLYFSFKIQCSLIMFKVII